MQNHKSVSRRDAIVALGSVLAAGFAGQPVLAALANPPPLPQLFGGPFSLTDHNGKTRTDKDFRGKFMLIYFGYTFCPDICPANLQHGANALDALADKGKQVTPIFVSIDPGRDTAAVLKDYVANFSDRFVGLTGSEKQIRAISKAYRIHRRKVLPAGETDKDNYLVDHSSITYLMGPDGKFVTLFPHNTAGQDIAKRISRYLKS